MDMIKYFSMYYSQKDIDWFLNISFINENKGTFFVCDASPGIHGVIQ